MQRRFPTDRINLCHQHQELASKTQKVCISSYCKAVLDPLEPAMQLKIRGQFQNPIKAERKKEQGLKKDYLLRFLLKGVSEIEDFNVETNNQIFLFSGIFHLRKNYGEDFILNLEHWPLGVEKLSICE